MKLVAVEYTIKETCTQEFKKGDTYLFLQDPESGDFYMPEAGCELELDSSQLRKLEDTEKDIWG
jgi:hypothetical protein